MQVEFEMKGGNVSVTENGETQLTHNEKHVKSNQWSLSPIDLVQS